MARHREMKDTLEKHKLDERKTKLEMGRGGGGAESGKRKGFSLRGR
jgi:hypothetical protein